jgi:phosphoglycolate phosphatase-like HAD superfamily hydrolase
LWTVKRLAGPRIVEETIEFFRALSSMEEGLRTRAGEMAALLRHEDTAFVLVSSPRAEAIDEATYLARFFSDGRAVDGPGLRTFMAERYRWLDGVPELLDELRAAGADLHALTNYPPWYRLVEERLGLGARVPWTFVSCERGGTVRRAEVRRPSAFSPSQGNC